MVVAAASGTDTYGKDRLALDSLEVRCIFAFLVSGRLFQIGDPPPESIRFNNMLLRLLG